MNNNLKSVVLTPMNMLYKLSPKVTLKVLYRLKTGQWLNLENPRTFNEKLQWIKLNYKNDLLPICVDKYKVRDFVKECGCENTLNKLIWEGFDPNDIPFEALPPKFVIKTTHGQGFLIICKDKMKLNIPKTKNKLKHWLKVKYLPCYGEWFYGIVKPRIIIEEYLDDRIYGAPIDYKVYCFHGIPKIINAHVGRFDNHKSNLYDLDWNVIKNVSFKYLDSNLFIEKPKELEQLLDYAKKLSKGFIHVRVDFYIVNTNIIFGELTFTDGAGFDKIAPREFDEKMGDWMKLQ